MVAEGCHHNTGLTPKPPFSRIGTCVQKKFFGRKKIFFSKFSPKVLFLPNSWRKRKKIFENFFPLFSTGKFLDHRYLYVKKKFFSKKKIFFVPNRLETIPIPKRSTPDMILGQRKKTTLNRPLGGGSLNPSDF